MVRLAGEDEMIWALLAVYFLGGGLAGVNGTMLTIPVVKELRAASENVISDPERAEAAQKILRELQKEIAGFERKFTRTGWQLNRYYKSHTADEQPTLDTLLRFNQDWEAMQRRAIDLRFRFREELTEEEWSALFASR